MRTSRVDPRAVARSASLADVGPDRREPVDGRVERGGVDGLEADGDRVVGRSGLDDDAAGAPRRCATCARRRGRLAGDEADDVGEGRREDVGLRHLEHEVGELDLVLHARPLWIRQRRGASPGKSRSVLARSAVEHRAGRFAGRVEPLGRHRGDEVRA